MKTPEEIRELPRLIIEEESDDGGCGRVFMGRWEGSVIWSNGGGWDHVSVAPFKRNIVPSWEDMCRLKDWFFHEDEVVVQYHPAKSQYVNNVGNCLHLWRDQSGRTPAPPSSFVGIRDGQTCTEAKAEALAICDAHG